MKSTAALPVQTNTTLLNGPPAVAALNNAFGEGPNSASGTRGEIQQLKDMIRTLGRETYSRIRGLARRNQGKYSEIHRERICDGRAVCFTCGRTGHLQASCPERRN